MTKLYAWRVQNFSPWNAFRRGGKLRSIWVVPKFMKFYEWFARIGHVSMYLPLKAKLLIIRINQIKTQHLTTNSFKNITFWKWIIWIILLWKIVTISPNFHLDPPLPICKAFCIACTFGSLTLAMSYTIYTDEGINWKVMRAARE